jgi:GNAT superfamily N-acetyltransferase
MGWRLMTPNDLNEVQALADAIHPDHPEDGRVFMERQRLYPQGCHVLAVEGSLIGYALTHPWRMGEPPPLNSLLGEIPRDPSTYYVHDVALLPEARAKGYASQVVEQVADHARRRDFGNLSLVAVNRSQMFWERLGFRAAAPSGLEGKLKSYGSDAVLMVRNLGEPRV